MPLSFRQYTSQEHLSEGFRKPWIVYNPFGAKKIHRTIAKFKSKEEAFTHLNKIKKHFKNPDRLEIRNMNDPQTVHSEEKTTTPQDSDIKDREGSQPKKYHAGLSKATKNARDAHFKKHGKKADDDASAYKPAPGDATAKTKPSKYTKAVNKMMDEETKGLAAKAKKSGISVGTLRKVYNRGVAAWKTGHRPGTTPQQWGHARVNAFIVKKKKGGLNHDKDLAEGNARTLSIAQRRQAARRLKRIKTRVKLGRKRALRRTPKLATLKKRAQRQTRSALFKRFSRGQAKKDVSMSRRASIERRINRLSKQRIKTMNVRQVRTARKIDRERRTSRK